LKDNPLPCKFTNVTLLNGDEFVRYEETIIDTGDFVQNI